MTSSVRAADPSADAHYDPASAEARKMLDAIVSHSRQTPEIHPSALRRRVLVAAAFAAAAAAAIFLVSNVGASTNHGTQALGPVGYRVTTRSDGAVQVIVRWNQVQDPAALQASLDQAQAHTKIWVTDTKWVTGTTWVTRQWCRGTVRPFTGQLDHNVVQYNAPGGASGLIIRPEKFPAGVTLLIAVQLSTDSPTGATGAPGTGVTMAGYGTTWAIGPTADCS